jgi:hypothetical protein
MGPYDLALKHVLTELSPPAFRLVTQASEPVVRWENVELQGLRTPRVDLLGMTASGALIHLELQSSNDPLMAVRMLEYSLAIRHKYGFFPDQAVLYVGREKMRMQDRIDAPGLSFRYRLIDVGAIEGDALLESPALEDNVIAILTRLRDPREAVRRALRRIAASEPAARERAAGDLGVLGGLRPIERIIAEETEAMPITEDIINHSFWGQKIREQIAMGRREGLAEGQAHERQVVKRMLEKRFGPMPESALQRFNALTPAELEEAALRLLDAGSLDEILG